MIRVAGIACVLLLMLDPEIWLPDLDSHQDKRLNRPPCYFDTTWQWRCRHPALSRRFRCPPVLWSTCDSWIYLKERGTCIVPFRRRMPHVFDHGSNLKLVGMAGFPP